jgi:hypothetical protein
MIELASGVALLAASIGFLRIFIPPEGANWVRGEWADVSIAIAFSGGVTFGVALIGMGFAGFWR